MLSILGSSSNNRCIIRLGIARRLRVWLSGYRLLSWPLLDFQFRYPHSEWELSCSRTTSRLFIYPGVNSDMRQSTLVQTQPSMSKYQFRAVGVAKQFVSLNAMSPTSGTSKQSGGLFLPTLAFCIMALRANDASEDGRLTLTSMGRTSVESHSCHDLPGAGSGETAFISTTITLEAVGPNHLKLTRT